MTDLLIKISQLESAILVGVTDKDQIKSFGLVRQFFDQQQGRIGLQSVNADQVERICLEPDAYQVHLAHRITQFLPVGQQGWGSMTTTTGDLRVNLLVATNRPGLASAAVRSVQTLSYLRFDGMDLEVMNVLSGEWKLDVDQARGLDPALSAFVVRYTIRGVDVTDFLMDF